MLEHLVERARVSSESPAREARDTADAGRAEAPCAMLVIGAESDLRALVVRPVVVLTELLTEA